MDDNHLHTITKLLSDCADIVYKPQWIYGRHGTLIYISSITDSLAIQEYIVPSLQGGAQPGATWADFKAELSAGTAVPVPYTQVSTPEEAVECIVLGQAVLCIEGHPVFYCFEVTQYKKRSITESQHEMVIVGPQEAFIEDIDSNLSLLRHKLKHPALKVKKMMIGKFTKSTTCVIYIEGLADMEMVEDIERKLKAISIDGVFGASYLAEYLKDNLSMFPLFHYTERPDAVAASLLEGRVGIMLEGSPSVLVVPMTMFSLLQSSEDYYQNYYSSSWIRIVRFLFAMVALLMPSLYIAITTFHPQIIPSNLLITIASARENIPFSALIEGFVMELTFEALREAGTRIPKPIGQTVSIIGGIVIGQAAVQAGIVSAPMVIVVSITGIASYIIPHLELGLAFRLLRFPLMILGGTMGLIGVIIGAFLIYAHMASLKSYNKPYLEPLAPLVLSEWKDTLFRFPFPLGNMRTGSFVNRRGRKGKKHP